MALSPLHELDLPRVLARSPGLALLLFTTPGCGACRAVRAALEHAAREGLLPDDLALYELDAGESAGLAADLEVFHLPSLFLFRGDELHAPVHAPPTAGALARAIEVAAAGPARDLP